LLFLSVLVTAWKERPDVIHGHLHEGALIGWAVKSALRLSSTPLIFDVQGSLVGELDAHGYFAKYPGLERLFWWLEYVIARLPNFLVCSSEASAKILRAEFGIPIRRMEVVSDGVDVDASNAESGDFSGSGALRGQLEIPSDRPVIIYTGALLPAKGVDTLKAVILEARKQDLDAHFVLIGYPEEPILEFVGHHGLEAYCTVVGRVPFEKLSMYLEMASIAVEPKGAESGEASGKLLNYMGAGLPVVCFGTSNNKSLLGGAGLLLGKGQ